MKPLAPVAWMLGSALCAVAACGTARAEAVYMSTGKSGRAIFTNEPLAATDAVRVETWPTGMALRMSPLPFVTDAPPPGPSAAWPTPRIDRASRLARAEIERLASVIAAQQGVDPTLVHAVIEVESGFNARAVSSAGARGLMQLMPQTAQRFGVRSVFDPADNIRGGVQYLRWLLTAFSGNVRLALAGYNAGEGAVIRSGFRVPAYAETQRYVPTVLAVRDRRMRAQVALMKSDRIPAPLRPAGADRLARGEAP